MPRFTTNLDNATASTVCMDRTADLDAEPPREPDADFCLWRFEVFWATFVKRTFRLVANGKVTLRPIYREGTIKDEYLRQQRSFVRRVDRGLSLA
jgi:hypothetical protein